MIELLKMIRWRLHLLSLSVLGAALVALVGALVLQIAAQQALEDAQNGLQAQQATNAEGDRATVVLRGSILKYNEFRQQGVIGTPQRLQWIETLTHYAKEYKIPQVSFILQPTQVAASTNTTYASDIIKMKVTGMQIKFTLLHEGDLFHLIRVMNAKAAGLFSVQNCDIARNEQDPGEINAGLTYSVNGFKGQCDLLWYSLEDLTSQWQGQSS